jgi:putative transposase
MLKGNLDSSLVVAVMGRHLSAPVKTFSIWHVGLEGTMKHMAGRKRHSAEDIVRKLRRADELAAEGKTGEEIAAELEVSPATLYNWRRTYGGMDVDAAKELKELREQNSRLKRLLAEAELEKDALREVAKGKF